MTSIDAIAFLFLVFFLIQFCLFLMLSWIVRQYIRAVLLNARESEGNQSYGTLDIDAKRVSET